MPFTIPMAAPAGTVIPHFSTVDTSKMTPPNGEIEIVPATSMPMTRPMEPMPSM